MNSLRHASQIIAADARQADSFSPGTNPQYATFSWVDYTSPLTLTYSARYYFSPSENRLMRDLSIEGSPSTLVVLENVASYGDVSMSLSGGILIVSLTGTVEGVRRTVATTENVRAKLRPALPAAPATPTPLTLAWDDFESGGFSGGSGWLAAWTVSGAAAVVTTGDPKQGTYHMRLRSSTGLASRNLNLSGQTNVRAQFWAKANNFNPGNTATFQVSPDGSTWTVVRTWVDGEDDNIYRFEDIDISSFSMTSSFWIRFQASMSNLTNEFYVDDLKIVSQPVPAPLLQNSGAVSPAGLFISGTIITGGQYILDFFNNSDRSLNTSSYSSSGGSAFTWVHLQAYKDYIISSTAGSSKVSVFARQFPGTTNPVTRQNVFLYSWVEP